MTNWRIQTLNSFSTNIIRIIEYLGKLASFRKNTYMGSPPALSNVEGQPRTLYADRRAALPIPYIKDLRSTQSYPGFHAVSSMIINYRYKNKARNVAHKTTAKYRTQSPDSGLRNPEVHGGPLPASNPFRGSRVAAVAHANNAVAREHDPPNKLCRSTAAISLIRAGVVQHPYNNQ